MKKKLLTTIGILLAAAMALAGLAGCGEDPNPYSALNLDDYLKVGKYKGVEVEKIDVTVDKSEIGDEIVSALDAAATEEDVKKGQPVENRDTVNIDYVGRIDGKKFEGGSAEGTDLELGSGTFIDGFEEGLVGHKVGEKGIQLNLAFPLNYSSEELQGKDVVFTVDINSATRTVQPEYNLEFVKTQGDYDSTEEYEKAVKAQLLAEKKSEALETQKTEIWSQVLEDTKVKKYPKEIVQHYIDTYSAQIDSIAEEKDYTRQEVMEQLYGITSEEVLQKQFKDSARLLVKQEMLIEYIAGKEGITYTDEEADALKEDIEEQGYDEEMVEEQTGRTMKQYVHIELLYEKVQDFLLDKAKTVE
ncbi:MAG: trigger factor [Lentihominibacter sp.]